MMSTRVAEDIFHGGIAEQMSPRSGLSKRSPSRKSRLPRITRHSPTAGRVVAQGVEHFGRVGVILVVPDPELEQVAEYVEPLGPQWRRSAGT